MVNYPTSLDNDSTLYLVADNVDDYLAVHHNALKDAVIALETAVGITSAFNFAVASHAMSTHSDIGSYNISTTGTFAMGAAAEDLDMGGFDLVNPLEIRYDGTSRPWLSLFRSNATNANTAGYVRIGKNTGDQFQMYPLFNAGGALTDAQLISVSSGGASAAGFGDIVFLPDNVEKMRLQADGVLIIANGADISPSSAATGQLKIDGAGYSAYVALDATGMYFGHNSGARTLVFQTNEADRLTISGAGAVTVAGALAANTFGGIASGNLVDKTADEVITGSWNFDTDTGTKKLHVSRLGEATAQNMSMWMDDANFHFDFEQDEASGHAVYFNSIGTQADFWQYTFQIGGDNHLNIDHDAITLFKAVTLSSIAAGSADYDRFLVSHSGVIKYRTGAQVLSDIGAVSDVGDHFYSLGGADFQLSKTSLNAYIDDTFADWRWIDSGGTNYAYANVHLPQGATVTQLRASGYLNSGTTSLAIYLQRRIRTGITLNTMALVNVTGTGGGSFTDTSIDYNPIDNDVYVYHVRQMYSSNSVNQTVLYSVDIKYTI